MREVTVQQDLFGPEAVRRSERVTHGVAASSAVVDEVGLRSLAFLYTASVTGRNSGIRFAMSVEDAMAWCESPISKGQHYADEWAYFWTSAWNFLMRYNGDGMVIDVSGLEDNELWDTRIADLGLQKIPFQEFPSVFGPLGVAVRGSKSSTTVCIQRAA